MLAKTKKRLRVVVIVIGLLILIPAWFAYQFGIIPRIDRVQTFHAPVFGPDGSDVYYLTRDAWGISWGPGIEFFTPPAEVIVFGDRFSLQSTDLKTLKTKTLHVWRAEHPFKPKAQYRNYLFGLPDCELRWEGRRLHYKIGLDFLPNTPSGSSINEWTIGSWNPDTAAAQETERWKSGYQTTDRWTEQILFGPLEIVDFKSFGLILYDSGAQKLTPVRVSSSDGPPLSELIATADLKDYIHRPQLERSRTIRETYSEIVTDLKAKGLSEGAAMLKANDEMEKKGLFPHTLKISAQKIGSVPDGVRVFRITNDEFRFGLFQDIEEAISKPGTEVHRLGKYVTHRDFDTSRELNEYLEAGNNSFIVKTERGMFLLSIR